MDIISSVPYALAIGLMMYAMTCTCPDVSYSFNMVIIYQENHGGSHCTSVKNILKYLRNTKDMFLVYSGQSELRLNGFSDTGFQMDKYESCSQSG